MRRYNDDVIVHACSLLCWFMVPGGSKSCCRTMPLLHLHVHMCQHQKGCALHCDRTPSNVVASPVSACDPVRMGCLAAARNNVQGVNNNVGITGQLVRQAIALGKRQKRRQG